jgi:hypothetical protein
LISSSETLLTSTGGSVEPSASILPCLPLEVNRPCASVQAEWRSSMLSYKCRLVLDRMGGKWEIASIRKIIWTSKETIRLTLHNCLLTTFFTMATTFFHHHGRIIMCTVQMARWKHSFRFFLPQKKFCLKQKNLYVWTFKRQGLKILPFSGKFG